MGAINRRVTRTLVDCAISLALDVVAGLRVLAELVLGGILEGVHIERGRVVFFCFMEFGS